MLGPVEHIAAFLTNPVIASLLFAAGVLCVLATIRSRQIGIATGLGLGALALFFGGHYLAGLAGWEGLVLVVLGLVLLGVELTVAPGFGIAGVIGVIAVLGGLFLSVLGGEAVTRDDLHQALFTVGTAATMLLAGGIVALVILPKAGRSRDLVLHAHPGRPAVMSAAEGPAAGQRANPVAQADPPGRDSPGRVQGVALSDLDPAGFALIDGERIDVVTQDDHIPAGATVEIIRDEGYRRVVRRLDAEASPDDR